MPDWVIYTDGSAPIVNPGGVIGFSTVFVLGKGRALEVSGGVPARTSDPPTSNNRAEIAGVIAVFEALYCCHQESLGLPKNVEIVCDSQYVVNCAQGRWKKHKNRDMWQRFEQLAATARSQKVVVTYRWTRAHVGTEWNERADVLAKEAAMSMEAMLPSPTVSQADLPGEATSDIQDTPAHDALFRLFAQMTGRSKAMGYYEVHSQGQRDLKSVEVPNTITLDEAEYHTLNRALEELIVSLKPEDGGSLKDIKICVESSRDLMLKQIQGIYGVKSERLIPLHRKTQQLIRQFQGVHWMTGNKNDLKALSKEA